MAVSYEQPVKVNVILLTEKCAYMVDGQTEEGCINKHGKNHEKKETNEKAIFFFFFWGGECNPVLYMPDMLQSTRHCKATKLIVYYIKTKTNEIKSSSSHRMHKIHWEKKRKNWVFEFKKVKSVKPTQLIHIISVNMF